MVQGELFKKTNLFDSSKGTKKCSKCSLDLPLNAFSSCHGGTYLRPECKKCMRDISKSREDMRRVHGMPDEDTYICPICLGNSEEVGDLQNRTAWVLDHCHVTNKFRGWLCHKCNRALGNFNDNVDILKRAIKYLTKKDKNETNT
jgi:hypothetical protein|tara:strand:+ start:551 stop:985 length:435 start_codon:yes stop_codon:yes gene_type:complete